ncbi:MAG: winged helix DNA-binding protein [Collinsella sp.]|nr:winged helix DNA-binding protein [Collinsella sp.]
MEDTDFRELGRQLFTEFGSMHQRISRFTDQALSGEMAVMRALMLAGGSLTPSKLADRAWVSSARIANILRALEAKGWIVREHSTTDRRRVHVTVTDKGRQGVETKRRELEDRTAAFLEQLGEADTQEMVRLLRRANQIIDHNQERRDAE